MPHPLKGETNASRQAKLRSLTSHYEGSSDKVLLNMPTKYKREGAEDHIGYGADFEKPNASAARQVRKPASGNAYATYRKGGRVKHRAAGGDTSDIEQADIDQKLES